MGALPITISIIYLIISFALIILVLMQQKKSAGLGSLSGMGSTPNTYWDKNKGRSLEGALHRYTKVLGTIFIVLSLVLTII